MKAILLDIDGTLTNDQKEITPETKRVLMKAQEQGMARCWKWISIMDYFFVLMAQR